jgi:membrane protein implicated in regulation of membrane protease activity
MDAIDACSVSYPTYYLLVVPCLLLTLYMGPAGFLLYMILRITVLKPAASSGTTTAVVAAVAVAAVAIAAASAASMKRTRKRD